MGFYLQAVKKHKLIRPLRLLVCLKLIVRAHQTLKSNLYLQAMYCKITWSPPFKLLKPWIVELSVWETVHAYRTTLNQSAPNKWKAAAFFYFPLVLILVGSQCPNLHSNLIRWGCDLSWGQITRMSSDTVTDWYDSNYLKVNYQKYASLVTSRTSKGIKREKYWSQGLLI